MSESVGESECVWECVNECECVNEGESESVRVCVC